MSKRSKKYQPEQEQEMIEMRNFNKDAALEEVVGTDFNNTVQDYSWISDANPNESKPINNYPNFDKYWVSQLSTNANLLNKKSSGNAIHSSSGPNQSVPSHFYKPHQPSVIRMNGMTFEVPAKSNTLSKPKVVPSGHLSNQTQRSKVPQMSVCCKWCTLQQVVAGNSHIFVCCVCNNMNECKPVYSMFVCCGCHTQVCYQLDVSNMIRCSKCRTINKVPMNVIPNYQSQIKDQPYRRPQPPKPEYLKGVQPLLNIPPKHQQQAEEEDIILLEQEPPMQSSQRYYPQKKEFSQDYPELTDEEPWKIQQNRSLLPSNSLNSKNTQM